MADDWSSKQPNFLQKLYEFLNLNPHPCPEVIYWAADSRQLVIAQSDRLVTEVLPKLFKHDKLASFGRQLNIYGFSRLFPGRQFKDAKGNVSDASVWAHPTLHRLSTPAEISAIKRRAAPKLVRTRRLASGEVVRSRAGPAVEAKFREVRRSMAESKRKHSSASATSTAAAAARAGTPDGSALALSPGSSADHVELDLGRYFAEDGAAIQDEAAHYRAEGAYEREAYMSPIPEGQQPVITSPFAAPQGRPNLSIQIPAAAMRSFHSAPASMHASSTVSPTYVSPMWPSVIESAQPMRRIAAPAAPYPFAHGSTQPSDPSGGCFSPDASSFAGNVQHDGSGPSMIEDEPFQQSAPLQQPMTIDPRWVSPHSSGWPTPAHSRPVSPRSVNAHGAQFLHEAMRADAVQEQLLVSPSPLALSPVQDSLVSPQRLAGPSMFSPQVLAAEHQAASLEQQPWLHTPVSPPDPLPVSLQGWSPHGPSGPSAHGMPGSLCNSAYSTTSAAYLLGPQTFPPRTVLSPIEQLDWDMMDMSQSLPMHRRQWPLAQDDVAPQAAQDPRQPPVDMPLEWFSPRL